MIWKAFLLVPFAGLLLAADAPDRFDWSTADLSYIGEYAKKAEPTRKLCASVIHAEPPAADRPMAAEANALKDCDSEALYYGIGMPANPTKARKCAIVEDQREPYGGPSQPYFGRGMLAIIYANGVGARQDFDVAIHMQCGLDNAPGDNEPRLERLAKLRASKIAHPKFDTCSDISSGALGGMCAGHDARVAEAKRLGRVARLGEHWSNAQRAMFDRTYASFNDYAYTSNEMECFGGTLHSACQTWAAEHMLEDFVSRVERLAQGKAAILEARADAARRKASRDSARHKDETGYLDEEDRQRFAANADESAAKRVIFERKLVQFFRATYPNITSHRVRRIFADL